MGVYGTDVIVPIIPIVLPAIFIVSKWDISSGSFSNATFRIEAPDKKLMGPVTAAAPKDFKGSRLMISLAMIPFQIQVAGVYKVYIKIDDEPEKAIVEFAIKLASAKQTPSSSN